MCDSDRMTNQRCYL